LKVVPVLVFSFSFLIAPLRSFSQVSQDQQLQGILGANGPWVVENPSPLGDQLKQDHSQPYLIAGAGGTAIHSAQTITADSEVIVRLRLGDFDGKATSATLTPGLPTATDGSQNLISLSLSMAPDTDPNAVAWSLPPIPGQPAENFWP
jgi:hypothetical protein